MLNWRYKSFLGFYTHTSGKYIVSPSVWYYYHSGLREIQEVSRICFSETLQEIGVNSLGKNLYFFLVGSLSTIIVIITLISLTDTNILRLQTAKVSFLVSAFLAFCSFYLNMWLSTEFPLYTSKIRSDMLSCFRINSVNPYHFLF